ncbi:tetratricopeptide repeat protein [Streptomyces graminilatus]|uniref:tetratricopeptide repeat protein n=1 Tax=Streptomyces graminilatus TaxID=1464070 RepID=UPI0006E3D442|nr:tetratricopeptide repeat protein [Streptomyces graminilatus]
MPPRTNDNAPDREQAPQPSLPRPDRELGDRPTDTAGTPGILGTEDAGATALPSGAGAAGPEADRAHAPRDAAASEVSNPSEVPEVPEVSEVSEGNKVEQGAPALAPAGASRETSAAETAPETPEVPETGLASSTGKAAAATDLDSEADTDASSGGVAAGSAPHGAPGQPSPGTVSPAPGDERVAAVRRLGESSRRWRAVQLGACAAALAVAFTAGAVVLGAIRDGNGTATVASAPAAMSPALLASGDIGASIASLQAHLRAQPKDYGSWATLGLAYVEQARTKGDPSRYPQAQQALDRSLELEPDNDPALAGRAALAAARHDFPGALKFSDKALARNPYSERALSTRIDALVELGRYDEALKATNVADAKRPGVPVFTRFAYVRELRGDVGTARRVLEQALRASTSRGDIAYVASALGQLAWNQGQYKSALEYYARALAADEAYLPALEGRSRAQFADGDRAGAIKGMEDVVSRFPLPGPLVELGELYEIRGGDGDLAKARAQYALVNAWTAIARANGVNADLDTALAAADHGDRKSALRAARAEWDRRETVHTADALAWALHVNGHDEEALPYARRATATGYHNASFLYHRGVIEQATGHPKEARASLSAALELNPGFSPLGARKARTALKSLEAAK